MRSLGSQVSQLCVFHNEVCSFRRPRARPRARLRGCQAFGPDLVYFTKFIILYSYLYYYFLFFSLSSLFSRVGQDHLILIFWRSRSRSRSKIIWSWSWSWLQEKMILTLILILGFFKTWSWSWSWLFSNDLDFFEMFFNFLNKKLWSIPTMDNSLASHFIKAHASCILGEILPRPPRNWRKLEIFENAWVVQINVSHDF